jgi:tetratricopeptide (TPR) repeat protein
MVVMPSLLRLPACLMVALAAGEPPGSPFAGLSFEAACRAAAETDKLVLVYVKAPAGEATASEPADVGPLEIEYPKRNPPDTYAAYTWSDEEVARWISDQAIAIEIEAGASPDFIERFAVDALPTVLVLDPNGAVRARIRGFRGARSFLREVKERIAASDPVAAARRRLRHAGADDAVARLAYARALEDTNRRKEALAEYIECLDSVSPAMGPQLGARLLAIEGMGRLARTFEPAREALIERHGALRERVLAGLASREDPALFAAMGTQVGKVDDTLAVYRQLLESAPDSITTLLLRRGVVDSLVAVRRYAEVLELIDVLEQFELAHRQQQADATRPLPSGEESDAFRAFLRRGFVGQAVRYYEILIGAGQTEDATRVAGTILEVDSTAATYAALAEAGLRTGRPTEDNLVQARQALALGGDPPDLDALITLVKICRRLGKDDEAARVVERYERDLPRPADRAALRKASGEPG